MLKVSAVISFFALLFWGLPAFVMWDVGWLDVVAEIGARGRMIFMLISLLSFGLYVSILAAIGVCE